MRDAVTLLLALAWSAIASAQPEAILLVAKPGLPDPDFREAVVLVTHAEDGANVGVILNRPTTGHLAELAPRFPGAANWREPLYAGGPVLRQVVIALFSSDTRPAAAAFEVLPHVYLSMHPANIEALLAAPARDMRLYAGFAGWAPQQLEAEIDGGSWYVMRVTPELAFRRDTSGMWAELVAHARGARAWRDAATSVASR
jgi:putative transcriptional regulator